MDVNVENLIQQSLNGKSDALEQLTALIQDKVYGLCLRMLYNPEDAADATQDILLKVITHLGTFRGESSFRTWVFRVAANHLLNLKRNRAEKMALTFVEYEEDLDLERARKWREDQDATLQKVFVEEIRISCLQGLLLCLDRSHRLVFLLHDIFGLNSTQGGLVLGIPAETYRKRLSRARERLGSFLERNCSLMGKGNPCRCGYHAASQLDGERFSESGRLFTRKYSENIDNRQLLSEMDDLNELGRLFLYHAGLNTPREIVEKIREHIHTERNLFLSTSN